MKFQLAQPISLSRSLSSNPDKKGGPMNDSPCPRRRLALAPLFLGAVFLFACSGEGPQSSSTSTFLPANPVGFRIQLDQGGSAALAPQALVAGAQVSITYAVMNVKRVSFLLPPGYTCVNYEREILRELEEREKELEHCEHCPKQSLIPLHSENVSREESGNKIRRHDQCEVSQEHPARIHFQGPFRVDLVQGTSTPPLENLAVPIGTYKRVDLRVDDFEGANTDPLNGYSLLMYGTYTSGSTTITFRIAVDFNEDIRFESEKGIVIDSQGGKDFLLQFPVSTWLGKVNLTSCFASLPPGTTFVDFDEERDSEPTDSCKIEKLLKESFKNSYRLKREDED